jgi:hypothetical protein
VTRVVREEPYAMSIRYRMIDATAVPKIPSAATDPSAFALGTWSGIWKRESGSRTTAPQMTAAVAVTSGAVSENRRCVKRFEPAYESDATTTASVPATAHHPPSGWNPASTPTPTRPRRTPARRMPVTRSPGRYRIARRATKMGTEAFAIAAMPESTCFSPHAISVNGMAPFKTPRTTPFRPVARSAATASRRPILATRNVSKTAPASSSRSSIIGIGSISSTATLMKR